MQWAGYAVTAVSGQTIRYAETTFNVRPIDCHASTLGTSGFAIVDQWVGIDGFGGNTVEQDGIEGYCNSTSSTAKPAYAAWEAVIDPGGQGIHFPSGAGTIHAGDSLTFSVFWTGSTYQFSYTNNTTGHSWQVDQPCTTGDTCPNATAEVITEDPGGGPPYGISPTIRMTALASRRAAVLITTTTPGPG